jgi:hypothetical protein
MDRAEFLAEWRGMSFEERAAMIRVLIQEECIAAEVPIPDIQIFDHGRIGADKGKDDYVLGETVYEDRTINIYGGSYDKHGEIHFEDPWEAVATAYHELSHWVRYEEGSPPSLYRDDDLAESAAKVATENYKYEVDNHGPGPFQWPTTTY